MTTLLTQLQTMQRLQQLQTATRNLRHLHNVKSPGNGSTTMGKREMSNESQNILQALGKQSPSDNSHPTTGNKPGKRSQLPSLSRFKSSSIFKCKFQTNTIINKHVKPTNISEIFTTQHADHQASNRWFSLPFLPKDFFFCSQAATDL